MQPILHFNPDNWLQGKSSGIYMTDGLFSQMDGLNPYTNYAENSTTLGILQTGATPTDISGAVIDQKIQKLLYLGATQMIGLGYDGDIYDINPTTNTPSLADSGTGARTLTALVNGFISSASGAIKLYYIHRNGIGTWNFASTWSDTWNTALTAQDVHPVHFWENTYWIGNQTSVAKFDSSAAVTASALALPSRSLVTALSDDGYHLVIGASDISSVPSGGLGHARIYFWIGGGAQWQQEWPIPESYIKNIYNIAGQLYAIAGNALYTFSVSTPPQKIMDLDANHSTLFNSTNNHPQNNVTDRLGDALIWGGASYYINSFGKINSRLHSGYLTPWMLPSAATSVESLLITPAKKMYVGTTNSKLYTIDLTSSGNTSPNPTAITRWIDLKGTFDIKNIDFDFSNVLATGDVLELTLTNQLNQTFTATISFATYGAVYGLRLPITLTETKRLKMQLTWTGGNVRIYSITINGDKISVW